MLSKVATFILIVLSSHWLLAQDYELTGGAHHTVAVCPNGNVAAWGRNNHGQLGDGTKTNRSGPVAVKGLSSVEKVVSANKFNLALRADGTVWSWGNNEYGQLGNGNRQDQNTPVKVKNLDNVTDIQVTTYRSYALQEDGTLWGWGRNSRRFILGDGTYQRQETPVKILDNVSDFIATVNAVFVLREDGTVWSWGMDYDGSLGNGAAGKTNQPVKVKNLADVQQIYAKSSGNHAFALDANNTLWGWGTNNCGQLGDGTTTDREQPVQIRNLPRIDRFIYRGDVPIVLTANDEVWTWGCTGARGTNPDDKLQPFQVPALSNAEQFSFNDYATYFINEAGLIQSWGFNGNGQLGNGTTRNVSFKDSFAQVKTLSDVDTLFTGFAYGIPASGRVFALKNDTLYGWGRNNYGQVGVGNTTNQLKPRKITGFFPEADLGNVNGPVYTQSLDSATYRISKPDKAVSGYKWSVPVGWAITRQKDTLIQVKPGQASGRVCVKALGACGAGDRSCLKVRSQVNLRPDTTICQGDSLVLAPLLRPDESVQWNTGATSDSLVVDEAGKYTVTVKSDSARLLDSIRVRTAPKPQVYVGPSRQAFCGQIDTTLDPETKNAQTYRWNTGDTTKTLYVDEEGQYWLRVESEESCSNADTTELQAIAYPESFDSSEITACQERVELDAGNPGASHQWNTGDTTQTLTVRTDGRYTVKIANQFCTIRDAVQVKVDVEAACPYLWVPNSFSPNGDGLNDVFKPQAQKIRDYELTVYNRWGERVFQSAKVSEGWDGTFEGKQAPKGVYMYQIVYKLRNEEGTIRLKTKEGTVQLIR